MATAFSWMAQVGWATQSFWPAQSENAGVGDDARSWAYDGYRRRFWHGDYVRYGAPWQEGDVVAWR